ncbi:unnamed protein product [Cylindrotheca closterium]|uniref:YqgE/AlgH family protein n=1 Tax=Cylindrotheca closterium TaxID=2856 RepID=A0AAD2FLT8_9STRA|nr:unnamed protein product [Cylindrotheca closterium]
MASSSTSKSSLVIRRLYRNMLRTIKPYTSSPDAKVLHCLLHRTGLDDDISDWEAFVKATGLEKGHQASDLSYSYADAKKGGRFQDDDRDHKLLFRRLLREVVTGEKGLRRMPVPSVVDTSRLQQVIKREFRNEKGSSMSAYFNDLTRRQVAFTALRELNKKLSVLASVDSSEVSPNQAAWHVSSLPISKPSAILQPGVFLMSHPHMSDSFFSRTVICILDYENEAKSESAAKRFDLDALGPTYGLIVNRVSMKGDTNEKRTLREAFDDNMLPERMADIFGDMPVKDGGPVHPSLQMLYSLPGSKENTIDGTLIPTIPEPHDGSTAEYTDCATYFQGDVFDAMTAIKDGKLDKNEMSFFVGASTWAPGQLESEMAHGFWIPCRGPAEIALSGTCEHEPSTDKSDPPPAKDLWLSMMSACGQDEARLASIFHHQEWNENMLPCDAFDGEDIDPDIF